MVPKGIHVGRYGSASLIPTLVHPQWACGQSGLGGRGGQLRGWQATSTESLKCHQQWPMLNLGLAAGTWGYKPPGGSWIVSHPFKTEGAEIGPQRNRHIPNKCLPFLPSSLLQNTICGFSKRFVHCYSITVSCPWNILGGWGRRTRQNCELTHGTHCRTMFTFNQEHMRSQNRGAPCRRLTNGSSRR